MSTFIPGSTPLQTEGLPSVTRGNHVAVVGAGAFGGWVSLYLLRKGCKVTLIDAWGPGHGRGSSGDETRVIRSAYGSNEFYFNMAYHAMELWREHEMVWKRKLFHNVGAAWFCYGEKVSLVDESLPFAKAKGKPYEYLAPSELKKRYPIINTEDLHHAWIDVDGGYLRARESCQAVVEAFLEEGGQYVQAMVTPGMLTANSMHPIKLSDGTSVSADVYLFACGPWMGKLFPEILGGRITVTRQEVYYIGPPAASARYYESLPAWVDADGTDYYYGIPGNAHRGFKVGVDRRGPLFDPETGDRLPSAEVLDGVRKFLSKRFPGLANAPLTESRVCAYESSFDGNFIFETHPTAQNVVFLGGGSGHGFKHGPALGEWVSAKLLSQPTYF